MMGAGGGGSLISALPADETGVDGGGVSGAVSGGCTMVGPLDSCLGRAGALLLVASASNSCRAASMMSRVSSSSSSSSALGTKAIGPDLDALRNGDRLRAGSLEDAGGGG